MTEPDLARIPPCDIAAEQAVLGACLLEGEAAGLAIEKLRSADFYRAGHRLVFLAIRDLANTDIIPDQLLVRERLEKAGKLDEAGGADYLHELARAVPSAANIERYADIVKDLSVRRTLINAATATLREAEEGGRETDEILERGLCRFEETMRRRDTGGPVLIADIMPGLEATLEARYKDPRDVWGLATGLQAFDKMTGGLHGGQLCVLAARTSVGKTAMLLTWLEYITREHPALLFSLEMPKDDILARLISMRTGVSFRRLLSGRLADQDWDKIVLAESELNDRPMLIDDTSGIDLWQVRARSKMALMRHGIKTVGVDYLQIMTPPKSRTREREVAAMIAGLKGLARELNVPVIVLSQFRKAEQGKEDRMPHLDDLRDSGAIPQDADVVVILHRLHKGASKVLEAKTGFKIDKQRNGPTGARTVWFDEERICFVGEAPPEPGQTGLGGV